MTHKVVIRSEDRISGTKYNFQVPITISQLENLPKITEVKLEWTSMIVGTSFTDYYIATDSLSSPQSFFSAKKGDTNILGVIPPQASDLIFYHFATPESNSPLHITNGESVLKSGYLNIRIVDRNNVDISTFNQEFTLSLIFS